MKTTLLEQTLDLIHNSGESLPAIARATGVNQRWLRRLVAGDYAEPGVNKIERIHDYLTTKDHAA